jgi:peptidoglycan/xylan/chitin deacetylase (PgdA/CDA1 family)
VQLRPGHDDGVRPAELIHHGPREVPRVALTFDDGPGPNTDALLDALRRAEARATHFVVGERVEAGAAALRRAVAEGHELANHSWSHPDLTGRQEEAAREIELTNAAIERTAAAAPRWFRPPFGRGADSLERPAHDLGLEVVMWDVDARDWEAGDAEAVTERVLNEADAGSIVVMHDQHGEAASATIEAVGEIAAVLRQEGSELVTVSELLAGAEGLPGRPLGPDPV